MRLTLLVPRSALSTLMGVSLFAFVLAGCASGPKASGAGTRALAASTARDGPETHPPADLAQVPDAEPRVEAVRPGGANKPYQALGRDYVPLSGDPPFSERGLASWYGRKFQGRRTASGEPYDMYAMTAAHPTLPIPSYARIRNPANGREVVVRINDRGPFHSGRIVDLSYTAALKLDVLRGVAPVELERITYEDVRTGAWRRGNELRVAAVKPSAAPAIAVMPTPAAAPPMTSASSTTATKTASESADAADLATPLLTPTSTSIPTSPSPSPSKLPSPSPLPADLTPTSPLSQPAAGFYVQLGAFRERDGAEVFQRRVLADADWLSAVLAVFGDDAYYRLQAGPYVNRSEATRAADRMRADLQLVPLIVERH